MEKPSSRAELLSYWKDPKDNGNSPECYLDGQERSEFLANIIKKYASDRAPTILELGCNVGRNMNYLFEAGFKNLSGVEINAKAIEIMRAKFPNLSSCKIYNSSIEDWLRAYSSDRFNIVFSMAVLEHLHSESEWVFQHISKIVDKYLVTIEDEKQVSVRHFPRKYKKIFESFGMIEIEQMSCRNVEGLGSNFVARIFKK